jgi:hypothetical protein
MGKSKRAYKSAKRSKELARQKKKEEKMKRRLAKERLQPRDEENLPPEDSQEE